MIKAADLIAPNNAYFEFEAHPAIIIPYIPNEVIANIYKSPALISDKTRTLSKGTTAQAAKATVNVIIGANKNKNLFESVGITISLKNNLTPSAKGCSKPLGPTTLGPSRPCIEAIIFLSAYV